VIVYLIYDSGDEIVYSARRLARTKLLTDKPCRRRPLLPLHVG